MTHWPWLPYLVTDYIEHMYDVLLPKRKWDVFEWGCGASTLFFSIDLGAKVISVEHNQEWFSKIDIELRSYNGPKHCQINFIPPEPGSLGSDPGNPEHYKSASTELGEVNFKNYVSAIDEYGDFDLILIDGMARASCLAHAFSHVKPDGCIVLDNTGDRPYYLAQAGHLFGNWESGWEKLTFMGYGPILAYKWETTIFINRGKGFYEPTQDNQ